MTIQAIRTKIYPVIKKIIDNKLNTKTVANTVENAGKEEKILFSNNSELAEKRKAVNDYLKGQFINPAKKASKEAPTADTLGRFNVSELIKDCGDNLSEIERLYGNYGLLEYVKAGEKEISGSEVFSQAFNGYLLKNPQGTMADIAKNFGQSGMELYKNCSTMGYVKTGINSLGLETYKLNDFGQDVLKETYIEQCSAMAEKDFMSLFE